jgi:hypothetical protein
MNMTNDFSVKAEVRCTSSAAAATKIPFDRV